MYRFCVQHRSQETRQLAQQLTELGFPVEWCVQALEKTRRAVAQDESDGDSSDEDGGGKATMKPAQAVVDEWRNRAVQWLLANAPRAVDA